MLRPWVSLSLTVPLLAAVACGGSNGTNCTVDCATGGTATGGALLGTGGDVVGTGGMPTGGGSAALACPSAPAAPVVPDGTTLDAAPNPAITSRVLGNHLGYDTKQSKRAVVLANGSLTSFQVARSSDSSVVFVGTLEETPGFTAFESNDRHFVADFSALRTPGTYRLVVNGALGEPFEIADDFLAETVLSSLVGYFRGSRADDAAVWSADENVSRTGGGASEDVRGGWYDASGDISKYLSHLNYANFLNPQQIPLVAWALAFAHDEGSSLVGRLGQTTAVEEEALWGADYLVRVLDDAGYFYINVFDTWTGMLEERTICAFEGSAGTKTGEYQAGFREGGGTAVAALARISRWGKAGSFSAAEYLAAAEKGYAHLKTNSISYLDNGAENVIDDYTALLAATELYGATNEAAYLDDARIRAESLAARLGPEGYFIADGASRPFWHASDAGLPVVALVRYAALETEPARKSAALGAAKTHLDYLLDVTTSVANPFGYARQHFRTGGAVTSGFFIPHDNETGYWWQGESARLASLAAAAQLTDRALRPADCTEPTPETSAFARAQLDWVLGKNPEDISFMEGFGRNNPPHYCSEKAPYHGSLTGGIANGITGRNDDGTGIQWMTPTSGENCWENWRWVEQWLPHSTWFLIATVAEANADAPAAP